MPSIANALNDHVRRLSRREINRDTKSIRKLTAQHRRDLAELKRQVVALQKSVAFLERQEKKRGVQAPLPASDSNGLRFRADGLRSHRRRIGLSAEEYGKLVGVSGQSIYNWEAGKSRPRSGQMAKLASMRGVGKREALKRLELLTNAG